MASGNRVIDGEWLPAGYAQLTAMTGSTALVVPTNATLAILQAEAQAVRWRDDGTAPTATVGMLIAAGESLTYNGNLHAVRFIQVTAGAILNVAFFR